MATNPFFNQYYNESEQQLLQDLVSESTQIFGVDCYYVPRRLENYDKIYGADDMSIYDSAYPIECFVENVYGFEGQKDFFSKFGGVEIRDQIILSIPFTTFETLVQRFERQDQRPLESDLIYFTLNKKCFKISYVDNKPFFYPLGILPSYKITLELFEYSSERFSTGIPEIDALNNYTEDQYTNGLLTPSGNWLQNVDGNLLTTPADPTSIDPQDDSSSIDIEADEWLNFTEQNPFTEKGSW